MNNELEIVRMEAFICEQRGMVTLMGAFFFNQIYLENRHSAYAST
jgi:hypothetical protein